MSMIARKDAYEIVIESLNEVFAQTGAPPPAGLGEDTVLVGTEPVLDSLGVVQLIVEVEQRVEQNHGISVTLANDKAMSARNSPFRTVGVLADHVVATAQEAAS
jgi:acyl carrier protein